MSRSTVLIVDDEPDIRELVAITLERMDIESCAVGTLADAFGLVDSRRIDLCLTDMRLPDGSGIELVEHIVEHVPSVPIAVITAHGNMETAVAALKAGAFDFVSKPLDLHTLRTMVRTALRLGQERAPSSRRLIGNSRQMHRVRATVAKLARSQAPVFVSGESGTGKELVAQMIHELGPRSGGPFVPVNCGAIPGELMESELFGHKKGSFTGAVADYQGLFRAAEGGTLFLDEVAELPLPMQVKLLRAIQEKLVRPVGSAEEVPVNARIISASHQNLGRLVGEAHFRQDLYYRLNVINLDDPPLRERPDDILELADNVLSRLARAAGKSPPLMSRPARLALQQYAFPGNVRELENILERAFTLCEGTEISAPELGLGLIGAPPTAVAGTVDSMPPEHHYRPVSEVPVPEISDKPLEVAVPSDSWNLQELLDAVEKRVILDALEKSRWNKTAAARRLGISFGALRYRMQKFGMH